jgi:hypothetical protein
MDFYTHILKLWCQGRIPMMNPSTQKVFHLSPYLWGSPMAPQSLPPGTAQATCPVGEVGVEVMEVVIAVVLVEVVADVIEHVAF